jgi:LemA protein
VFVLWIALGVLVVLAIGAVGAYNGLVRRRTRTAEAWSQIDVELRRRHDLIPNLVQTVSGYAAHERGTLDSVTQARAAAVTAGRDGDPRAVAQAENALSTSLRSLFAVAENYPDLKAVQSFTALQEQLTATEDKLEYARRYYNTSARDYDAALLTFPRNVIAGPLGLRPVGFFEADVEDEQVPEIRFPGTPPQLSQGPVG